MLLGPEERKQLKLASRVSAVGIELVLAVCLGYFGGRWLDGRLDTAPLLAYLGLVLGMLAGFRGLWYAARPFDPDRIEND